MQSRRTFLKQSMALFGCGVARAAQGQEQKRPNFLFIFADDHSYEAIHALGCDEIHTPNLDKLVHRGTTFTNAYNMGSWSGAVCVASRHMLITGFNVWNAHKAERGDRQERSGIYGMADARQTWPQLLEDAGYSTYMTGKWHVKAPAPEIFQVARDVRPGMPNQTEAGYNRPKSPKDYAREDAWKPWKTEYEGFWKGGKHWSEIVGDHAIDYIEDASGKENPFFIYAAFNAPHDPRQAPKSFVDMYPLDKIKVPENFLTNYPYDTEIGCDPEGLRDERLAPSPRTEFSIKVNRQEYYAIITHMDEQIGRILDALEASGEADNTYIFFTADHGLAVGRHGLIGKQNMYEHSVRTPFMVVGPGIEAGKRLRGDIYLQDIMPTTLELAGVEKPERVYFKSIMPMIRGERPTNYEAVYGAYLDLQRSVRGNGYKLIAYPKAGVVRLYDLDRDPHEIRDLANDPEYRELRKRLFRRLLELQKEVDDELDLTETFPEFV